MKIDFVRTGGFAGLRLARTFDTAALPEVQRKKIEQLVSAARFFDLEEGAAPERSLPDAFEYRLSISSEARNRTIVVREAAMPTVLRPLVDYLVSLVKAGDTP